MHTEQTTLLRRIVADARALIPRLPPDAYSIRGVWRVEFATRVNPSSTTFHLRHLCIETNQIGSAYYADEGEVPVIDDGMIGSDVLELGKTSRPFLIAGMDAVYGNVVRDPDELHILSGPSTSKASDRAAIVCAEVIRLAKKIEHREKGISVVNVGVVGDFLDHLRQHSNFHLVATDLSDALIDHRMHGVLVQGGQSSAPAVASADIALVTGMTLSTKTLDGLLKVAATSGTAVVIFAETGANFAEVYLREGAATVVAEPYPFYLSGASTCAVKVYRDSR